MLLFFNTIIDTLIRNVHFSVRAIISLAFFALAAYSIMKSIKKKDDKHPIAWGWFILCFISMFLGVVYVAL